MKIQMIATEICIEADFQINIIPINPTLVSMIIGATIIIVIVIIAAYWYLRRVPRTPA